MASLSLSNSTSAPTRTLDKVEVIKEPFNTDTTGNFTASDATIEYFSGAGKYLKITDDSHGGGGGYAYKAFNGLTPGALYAYDIDCISSGGAGGASIKIGKTAGNGDALTVNISASGSAQNFTGTFVATHTKMVLSLVNVSVGAVSYWDDIEIEEQ
jgi:hypothetical protein